MIYLLRHGEIENNPRRFVGQADLPLTSKGKVQAKRWHKLLSKIKFDFVYSSDLSRCADTARTVAGKRKHIEFLPELREINLGKWEGIAPEEIQKQFPEDWKKREENIAGYKLPGGESFYDVRDRAVPAFEKIAALPTENILIVSHAGAIRAILCHVLGIPLDRLFTLGQDYSGLNLINEKKTPMLLVSMNMHFLDFK